MNDHDLENQFLEITRGLLRDDAQNLEPECRARLEQIRTKALRSVKETPKRFFTPMRWIMVGGFATATMAAALFFWLSASPGSLPVRHIEDLEILTSREQIDFYQNLEFYRWLATKEKAPIKERVS